MRKKVVALVVALVAVLMAARLSTSRSGQIALAIGLVAVALGAVFARLSSPSPRRQDRADSQDIGVAEVSDADD